MWSVIKSWVLLAKSVWQCVLLHKYLCNNLDSAFWSEKIVTIWALYRKDLLHFCYLIECGKGVVETGRVDVRSFWHGRVAPACSELRERRLGDETKMRDWSLDFCLRYQWDIFSSQLKIVVQVSREKRGWDKLSLV